MTTMDDLSAVPDLPNGQRPLVFASSSVPPQVVPWGMSNLLIGRTAGDVTRYSERVTVKVTTFSENAVHHLHAHADQDEILFALKGHGENVSADGTVQSFGPGDVVYIPAGTLHEDRAVDGPATVLVIKIPPD